ncbi:MAG: hypothetical protein ONB11_10075 [candidate division KSB1 bacterium]|nr:hypothetical protein [candidate division KSB1 bacterium]
MKNAALIILVSLMAIASAMAEKEITFVSQTSDSLLAKTLSWQPPNDYRPMILLDGQWEYRLSPKDYWKKVSLPAACDYEGEISFRKTFAIDSSLARHSFRLVCYGIHYRAMIFVNSKFIGTHVGGYSSFAYDLPEDCLLPDQPNTIEIRVDTRLDAKRTLPQKFQPDGIKPTGGIYRSLYLLAIPEVSLADLMCSYQLSNNFSVCDVDIQFNLKSRLADRARLEATAASQRALAYRLELFRDDPAHPVMQQSVQILWNAEVPKQSLSARFALSQPQLWSPEKPNLYHLKVQLLQAGVVVDQLEQTIGIKQLEFTNGTIFLNGQPYLLKGVNWCEDYGQAGAVLNAQRLLHQLGLIKQLHANAVRVLYHPAHPMVAALCDSLGLFLLQELPLSWVPPAFLSSEIYAQQTTDYFQELIRRDGTHVSVFAWGLGGQFSLVDAATRNLMNKILSSVDAATCQPVYIWQTPSLAVSNAKLPDGVISGISVFNLEKSQLQQALSQWVKQASDQIQLVLSYGAAQFKTIGPELNQIAMEEYQVLQLVNAWTTIQSFPAIDGYFISGLSDFEGNYPSCIVAPNNSSWLRPIGLTAADGQKRLSYEAVQSLYLEGKCRYNAAARLPDTRTNEFLFVGLATLLVFLILVNSRRYFRDNFKRIFIHPHGFYVDVRDGRKVPPSHTIFMALFIAVGLGLVTASLLHYFKHLLPIDHVLTLILPRESWKSFICRLAWQPRQAILFFSVAGLVFFFLIALYFKMIALFSGNRTSLLQALTIAFWLGGSYILFVPIGSVLNRILQHENSLGWSLAFILLIDIWFFFRMIKGMRVMFKWPFRQAILVLILTIVVISGGMLYYYQTKFGLIDYLQYYYQIFEEQIISQLSL